MKTFLTLATLLISFNVQARVPAHPCAPVVKAVPTTISCSDNGVYYGIKIHTRMSDTRLCPPEKFVEINAATVIVGDFDGNVTQKISLGNGEFSYTLSPMGDATFVSEKASLDLKDCSAPLHGGFSVGN